MTLNLSSSNRASNYYLTEIDKVKSSNDATQTQLNLTSTTLNSLKTEMNDSFQVNYKPIGTKHFNDDVILYLDFSDDNDIAKDISGSGLHGKNINGVTHSDFNTHSALFDRISHHSIYKAYENQRCIDMTEHISEVLIPEYSLSFAVAPYSNNTIGCVCSFTDNRSPNEDSHLLIYIDKERIRIFYVIDGLYVLRVTTPVMTLINGLYYITLTSSSSGHNIYANGTLVSGDYQAGDTSTPIDLSVYDSSTDSFTIGALRQGKGYSIEGTGYKYPFSGKICDFMIHNRVLTQHEITMYASGVVGYDVILLGGASNMTGQAVVVPGIDDDYSEHNNRVIQYKTRYNVDLGDPTKYSSLGTNGFETNIFETASGQLDYPELNYDNKIGPWRTFMNDI